MKKTKKSRLWYNTYGKEVGGVLLEGRLAAARWNGPCPDARAGLRMMGVYSQLPNTIL